MKIGDTRMFIAGAGAALGFVCGLIGLLAGLTDHSWKLGSIGWFTGGCLLVMIALFILLHGAVANQHAQKP